MYTCVYILYPIYYAYIVYLCIQNTSGHNKYGQHLLNVFYLTI